MSICPCGYWWADCDEDGTPISLEYCHYEGPAEWAPCAQDELMEEIERDEREYEEWIDSLQEEMMREELGSMYDLGWDEESTFEEYGAPYDYKEF